MDPLALLILVANCATTVHALPAGAPAARFWQEALPGTPMPEAIADLIQKGIDHSPLLERKNGPVNLGIPRPPFTIVWRCVDDCPDKAAVPPGLFFRPEQVRVGSTMTVAFPPGAMPGILPQNVAEKVPFGNLTDVLSMFNVTPSSKEAATVANTLRRCQDPSALSDEKMACTTSLESTVKRAMHMLGTSQVSAVASELSSAGLLLQPYLIQEVSLLNGSRHVGCHNMPFPYAVYDCHMAGLQSKAYVISLRGLRKGPPAIAMAAICHFDTSSWSSAYPAFEILHSRPGSPVCHFLQYASILFVNKNANA